MKGNKWVFVDKAQDKPQKTYHEKLESVLHRKPKVLHISFDFVTNVLCDLHNCLALLRLTLLTVRQSSCLAVLFCLSHKTRLGASETRNVLYAPECNVVSDVK